MHGSDSTLQAWGPQLRGRDGAVSLAVDRGILTVRRRPRGKNVR